MSYKKIVECKAGEVEITYTSGNVPVRVVAKNAAGEKLCGWKNGIELPRDLLHEAVAAAGGQKYYEPKHGLEY